MTSTALRTLTQTKMLKIHKLDKLIREEVIECQQERDQFVEPANKICVDQS